MSGHSKWATIKRKKGAIDQKRGVLFSKLAKEISVAAREGGANTDANVRLRAAVARAKSVSMPSENIEKAILRGTGQLPGQTFESIAYEGYGPGGVAVIIECLTDSRNRTTANVRHAFTKQGGNMGESGCVNWMFNHKGNILVKPSGRSEDELLELVMESGGEDFELHDDGACEIKTEPANLHAVAEALEKAGMVIESSELTYVAQNYLTPDIAECRSAMKLIQALEDDDDVQAVYSNLEPPEELLADE